jgi:hypothetical protein
VPSRLFVISIGLIGLLMAVGTYLRLRLAPRARLPGGASLDRDLDDRP